MPHSLPCPPLSRLLLALLASWTVLPLHAQAPVQSEGNLQFIGSSSRVSLGVANGANFQTEWLGVLHEDANSAWLADAWLARSAGGAQLSYQRVSGDAVHKYFLALDQNQTHDRKATLGAGLENARWFGNVYVSQGVTGRRLIGQNTANNVSELSGAQDGRPFVDTVTRTTTTRVFERAYDHGVGMRAGHYYSDSNLRLTAGLDLEWGRSAARQSTLSIAAEKFFVGTPHSVALQIDHLRKQGDADLTRNDNRAMLTYRYSFGAASSQPERLFRMVERQPPVLEPTIIPARTEQRLVKTKASMTGDAFFDLSSATLSSLARAELDRIAALLKSTGREGNVRIVGHTCDLGSDKLNNLLSIKRAEAVRDYLVAAGGFPAEVAIVEGRGESEPKFPATAEFRERNRRVDLEFFSVTEKTESIQIPAQTIAANVLPVTFEREDVAQEPAWLRRALRTPALHKRTVDVYRSTEQSQTENTTRAWINRVPQAQADAYSVIGGSRTVLAVLANDSDPDAGDVMSLESVSAASYGQVRLEGGQVVYVAPLNFRGQDHFTYIVRDRQGGSANASVTVTVTQPNQMPIAVNDTYTLSGIYSSTLSVLSNDRDPDGDPLSIYALTQPLGNNGTVSVVGSQILFIPSNQFLQDTFTYTITDGRGGQSSATVLLIDP